MRILRWSASAVFALLMCQQTVFAQQNATVTGRVTDTKGNPQPAVMVRIPVLNVGTPTISNGTYRMVVPASRLPAVRSFTITAAREGLKSGSDTVTLGAGANVTKNFALAPITVPKTNARSKPAAGASPKPKPKTTSKKK